MSILVEYSNQIPRTLTLTKDSRAVLIKSAKPSLNGQLDSKVSIQIRNRVTLPNI